MLSSQRNCIDALSRACDRGELSVLRVSRLRVFRHAVMLLLTVNGGSELSIARSQR